MKYTVTLLALFFFSISVMDAQTYEPCGTPSYRSDWLKRYQANPTNYRTGVDTVLYIPLTIHIVGNDAGQYYHSISSTMDAFCTLNDDFADSKIQFYIEGDIRYIDSSAYFAHSSVIKGYEMMTTNNVPNTINCYIVSNPANTGGYNLPSAKAVCLRQSSTNAGNHTWAHEIGHNLSVQHPFLGWEGDTYSYSTPTPTTVTYDYTLFKDSLITDTTIIDTAFVELMDGSNCQFAADGFCDTPPDYLSFGWQCDGNFESQILQKDPNNIDFRSDATNIMNYSFDGCQSKFTNEQMAAMRANIYSTKSSYLYNQNPARDTITQVATLLQPIDGGNNPSNQIYLEWSAVPGANKYLVQVSRFSNFAVVQDEFIVANTSITKNVNYLTGISYKWRVRALNEGYSCTDFSSKFEFTTTSPVNTNQVLTSNDWLIYPNPLLSGGALQLAYQGIKQEDATVSIYDLTGKELYKNTVDTRNTIEIPSTYFPSQGVYLVVINTANQIINEKIVVLK